MIHLLRQITEESEIRLWRHYPISAAGYLVRPGQRVIFTTVRNPWNWYVSLWSHGMDGHSAIRRFLKEKMPERQVAELYSAANPKESFQRWLAVIHNPDFVNKFLGEGYPRSKLSPVMGLYTYRFQRVTTRFPYFFLRPWFIKNPEEIAEFHRHRKVYQTVLRTENLTADFTNFIRTHGERCGFKPEAENIVNEMSRLKRNASTRLLPHYRDYYDEESRRCVELRDHFFIDEFGYQF